MSAPARDARGQSISVFVLLVMGALVLVAGLVVDGGQKVGAATLAESAAAAASRSAGNAAATQRLGGADATGAAVFAAKASLRGQPGVLGEVTVVDGVVTVRTTSTAPTVFLSVVGIDSVTGTGTAQADIVATGQTR